ncbi:MAG: endolytic transglycosylase MltG [Flavobacteriales bacterium]
MSDNKKSKKIFKTIGLLVVLGLLIGSFFGYNYYSKIMLSNVQLEKDSTFIYIKPNSDTKTVSELLLNQNILKNVESFEWLAEKKNYRGKHIVPGKYNIKNGWSNNDLLNHLRAGNGVLEVKVQFNQKRDLEQLAGALSKNIMIDSVDLYQYITSKEIINHYGFNKNTMIAMFIPNTYNVDWAISKENLIKRMAKEYKRFWNADRKKKLKRVGISQSEAITLASIVYWETKIPKDKKTIAGVYLNRIRIGMPLQADPTLIYASGDYSLKRVLNKHKEINSPYNTYKNRGLPPGPILIPPISYIDAVLNFEKHSYLYFVAKEDFSGESYFSKNYTQHLRYARLYQNALNKRKIFK